MLASLLTQCLPGANPTTLSYSASVVKIYSSTNRMARFNNKYYFSLM
jgi:hypothetical protein